MAIDYACIARMHPILLIMRDTLSPYFIFRHTLIVVYKHNEQQCINIHDGLLGLRVGTHLPVLFFLMQARVCVKCTGKGSE